MNAFNEYESKKQNPSCSYKGCTHDCPSTGKQQRQDQVSIQRSLQKYSKNQILVKEPKIGLERQSPMQNTQLKFFKPETVDKSLFKDISGVKTKVQKEVKTQSMVKNAHLLKNKDLPQDEPNDGIKPSNLPLPHQSERHSAVESLEQTTCCCLPPSKHTLVNWSHTVAQKQAFYNSPNSGILYRNPNFEKPSSTGHSEGSNKTYTCVEHDCKEASELLISAREYCKKMNKHFKSKFEAISTNNLGNDCEELHKPKNEVPTKPSSDIDPDKPIRATLGKFEKASSESVSTVKSNHMSVSPKTVISAMSGADLRKMVISQIKTQEYIRKCKLKNRSNRLEMEKNTGTPIDVSNEPLSNPLGLKQQQQQGKPTTENCKKVIEVPAYQIDNHHKELNVIKEKVNARIITPMIGKVKRLYLNHLNEEMTIVEELERVPDQVGDLYEVFYRKQ